MILPSGRLSRFQTVVQNQRPILVGALSFEERCTVVPDIVSKWKDPKKLILFSISDPADGFPNYSPEIEQKVEANRQVLAQAGVSAEEAPVNLLATEDELSDMLQTIKSNEDDLYILDITSLPKRYFCYFVKHLLRHKWCKNLLVTYTMVGSGGYSQEHLTGNPMTCAPLPGFSSDVKMGGDTLVISLGFESLNVRSILDVYPKTNSPKILVSFPCSSAAIRRQWNMLRQIFSKGQISIKKENIRSVASWDAEEVFLTLKFWEKQDKPLALAPFGTKPHSLGMALYAIQSRSGVYYTQPKSYNPKYSEGAGESWGYLVKYDGIPCFERYKESI